MHLFCAMHLNNSIALVATCLDVFGYRPFFKLSNFCVQSTYKIRHSVLALDTIVIPLKFVLPFTGQFLPRHNVPGDWAFNTKSKLAYWPFASQQQL